MIGIKRFLSNRLTWVSAGFLVVFGFVAHFTQDATLAEGARTSVVALAFMGLIVYSGVAVRAYQAHRWPNEPLLAALATCLILAGLSFGGLFQMLWRLSDFNKDVVENWAYSFTVTLIAAGIFILIMTPDLFGRDVPRGAQARLGLAWAIVIAVIFGLTYSSPDLRWLADKVAAVLVRRPA
jgi:hypothetical protein